MRKKKNITELESQLRELIFEARQAAYRSVNTLQVITNFLIGKKIVEVQQQGNPRADYAKEQLTRVSRN